GYEALYPVEADQRQFASEKKYDIDFSAFNINGRMFGAIGETPRADLNALDVKLSATFGRKNPVTVPAPYILPAIAKLDWQDYYIGAALFGIPAVIGESAVWRDLGLRLERGVLSDAPLLATMKSTYDRYAGQGGEMILQCNPDDERLQVAEYAIGEKGFKTIELKFGQAAKGIQHMGLVYDIETASRLKTKGSLVIPDPDDEKVKEYISSGGRVIFQQIGRLPYYDEEHIVRRVARLRELGAERVAFKTAGYDKNDILRLLKIASEAGVDMITFDGAGGGTGNSPCRMMNEWGLPTVYLESLVAHISDELNVKGFDLPQITIAGGLALEDHIFKAFALGAPFIGFVAIGRAAMAAAMSAKNVGSLLDAGKLSPQLQKYGTTREDLFPASWELTARYGKKEADTIPTGAIGVYSYLCRITLGLRQLVALNRKFALRYLDKSDLLPLNSDAVSLLNGTFDIR
ncbi:MAG: glutamate synthase-related protein, partial [Synergistaceae bacterium]|nr:glutamate synthase-related protein [Synergistaceae bacterium]